MLIPEAVMFMLAYIVPICFLVHIGLEVLLRNPKKTEHRLASLITACYLLLFVEESVRFLLPIEYSAGLSVLWFSCVGLAIPGLGFHFLTKFAGFDKRMPKLLYPYIFYIPSCCCRLSSLIIRTWLQLSNLSRGGFGNGPYITRLIIGRSL